MKDVMPRRLPHLAPFVAQPLVFLTVVAEDRRTILHCTPVHHILEQLWFEAESRHGWVVGRYVIMPDHVHFFARPFLGAVSLRRWMQTWKSLSSRAIAASLGLEPPVWQRDYFDRFLRSGDSYSEKWNYVVANPVRKGLVNRAEDWPWQGVVYDLAF